MEDPDAIITSPEKKRSKRVDETLALVEEGDSDDSDDDYFNRMVDATARSSAPAGMDLDEEIVEEDAEVADKEDAEARWVMAMVKQATATSVVKDESDPVWLEDILQGVLGHGANTGIAAYAIDTDAKRLVLSKFLGERQSGGGTTASSFVPLTQRLMWNAVEDTQKDPDNSCTFYLDSLFSPQVALAVRHPVGNPVACEVLLHALNTDAIKAVLACLGFGVAASPILSWRLVNVDPLHETGLCHYIASSSLLQLTRRESKRLYVFSAECLSAWLPDVPAAAGSCQVRPFMEGGRRGHGVYDVHNNHDGMVCAATVSVGQSCWTLSTNPAYRGQCLELPLLRLLVQQERGGGSNPLWVGVAEEEDTSAMDSVFSRLGFVCVGTGVTLHADASAGGMCTD